LAVTSIAFALTQTVNVNLPGVNAAGALDPGQGSSVPITVNINTNNGTFTANGKGVVGNLSGKKQVFTNIPFDPGVPGVTVESNKYTVKKPKRGSTSAKCTATAQGTVEM